MSMMGTGSYRSRISQVRMFLRADSAEELVRLQLQNNVMLRGQASYTDITFADGFWYCWYLVDVDDEPQILKQIGLIDGTTQ